MRWPSAAIVAAVAFAAVAAPSAAGGEAEAEAAASPRFVRSACPKKLPPFPALKAARCGYLIVPESRSKANGQTIRLAVAVIPARSKRPAPDAVVHLTGGPGGIALLEAQRLVDAGFNRDRDLVIMDQRGTLYSQPALTCPVIDRFMHRLLGLRYDAASTERLHVAAVRTCRRQLAARGIDLAAYNTTENAADFADLRVALGYDDWNVFGVSYGTDLALQLLRDHPEGIRSVILDSPVPPQTVAFPGFWPNARDGFHNLFHACAAQPACNKAYPNLERMFTQLVASLEENPAQATVKDPVTGEQVSVVIDGGALANWLVSMSFYTPQYKDVPHWIAELADGHPEDIATLRAAQVTPPGYVGYGLSYGVVCREWFPFATEAQVLARGRQVLPGYPSSVLTQPPQFTYMNDDCRSWRVPAAPTSVRRPARSTVPVLVLSGSFDAVTPLRWGRIAASTLPNSNVVSIPGVGHFVAPESRCAQRVIASFLRRAARPDTACVRTLRPPTFATG